MIGRMLGRYRVLEKIGEGGMGVVYKAHDIRLDRPVAMKVLPAQVLTDELRKVRFAQEAKAVSALNHPNILHIYDIDSAEDVDFIAMEFVPGKTIQQLIGRNGIELKNALAYAIQI